MDDQSKRKRPTHRDESKRDAVQLVAAEGYSIEAASRSVGGVRSVAAELTCWCEQRLESHGGEPCLSTEKPQLKGGAIHVALNHL